jgi:hypothetical protein
MAPVAASLKTVSSFLQENFPGQFMVWNGADSEYDYSYFDNQVIEFKFPGYCSVLTFLIIFIH